MKKIICSFLLLSYFVWPVFSQSTSLFDDDAVAEIHLQLPPDSLAYLLDELVNDRYLRASFVFEDGNFRDSVANVGLRLRGNTSLFAQKKSFKISFNEFVPGREYQGVRKLNLRGQHNDPTMIREKLFYEVWEKAGMPERRMAFVKLFINGQYRGLYTNAEEIDKIWLEKTYDDNDGNLYKCTWPADLAYHGSNQLTYKGILNNPETRAYDLATNESEDNYAGLVALITALNQPVTAEFPKQISQLLNVDGVLKAFAIDVATGNWDDYFYNKNNYYLYDNPATGRFEFITFDTDNTFGVDWLGVDWATRNCLAWQKTGEPRPLATKLLQVPAFRDQYVRYLDTITRFITLPDSIFPRIDELHDLITPAAIADPFRTLDYGYTVQDFHDGFDQTVDFHTPYGIKPFLGLRADSTLQQIAGVLTRTTNPEATPHVVVVYPNPASDRLYIHTAPAFSTGQLHATLFDATGRPVSTAQWMANPAPYEWLLGDLPAGCYVLRLANGLKVVCVAVVKG